VTEQGVSELGNHGVKRRSRSWCIRTRGRSSWIIVLVPSEPSRLLGSNSMWLPGWGWMWLRAHDSTSAACLSRSPQSARRQNCSRGSPRDCTAPEGKPRPTWERVASEGILGLLARGCPMQRQRGRDRGMRRRGCCRHRSEVVGREATSDQRLIFTFGNARPRSSTPRFVTRVR
jgi:hypothetical protein